MSAQAPAEDTLPSNASLLSAIQSVGTEWDECEQLPQRQAVLADCMADLTLFTRGSALISRLDSVIAAGELFARATPIGGGQTVVTHGMRAFTDSSRGLLRDRQRAAAMALDALFRRSFLSGSVDAPAVMLATAHYLTAQTPNADLLNMAKKVGQDESLALGSLKTASLAMAIALEIGCPVEDVRTVGLCGIIHDWGMIRVPESIRQTTNRLSPVDAASVKQHSVYIFELLGKLSGVPSQLPLVCSQVHEAPDGSGYPRKRRAHAIHPLSRIVRVADIYVALTSPRPWRQPVTPNGAMECLMSMSAENRVDSDVVNKLLAAVSLYPAGSLVELSDGSVAQTLRPDENKHSSPLVRVIRNPQGYQVHNGPEIRLSDYSLRITRALPRPGTSEIDLSEQIMDRCLK